MPDMYNIEGLENGIENCRKNIKIFEEAIDKERETIKEYYRQIEIIERKEQERKHVDTNGHDN